MINVVAVRPGADFIAIAHPPPVTDELVADGVMQRVPARISIASWFVLLRNLVVAGDDVIVSIQSSSLKEERSQLY